MCLRSDIAGDQDFESENIKLRIYLLMSPLVPIIVIFLMSLRVRHYLRRFCLNGRFSCIGTYKRNVIDFKNTSMWFIYLCLSSFTDVGLDIIFTFYESNLSPEAIFWIWNIKGVISNDFFNLLLPLTLTTEDIVPHPNTKRLQQFYTRKPVVLEPRRQFRGCKASNKRSVTFVRECNPTS